MTFKEKLQKERPEIADKYFGCPKHLDYEDENIHCLQMSCIECWNRKIPGTEENTTTKEIKFTENQKINLEDLENGKHTTRLIFEDTKYTIGVDLKQNSEYKIEKKTTKNLADKTEEFICSVCHIHLFDFFEQKYNKDGDYNYEEIFECSYCPHCGRKVVK